MEKRKWKRSALCKFWKKFLPSLPQFIFECDSTAGNMSATVDALKADAEYFKVVSK